MVRMNIALMKVFHMKEKLAGKARVLLSNVRLLMIFYLVSNQP